MVGLNVAEWILVAFLSIALFIFIVVGIILLVKLIDLTKETRKIIVKSQDIAEKADDIVENVKDMTTIGGVVKSFSNKILEVEQHEKKKTTKEKK